MANTGWRSAAALARVISLEDIAEASDRRDPAYETPVLKLLSESKNKGYDLASIPLTNDKWRARWRRMCLSPDDVEERDENAERLSEAWRSNPGFLKHEVTITRLGKTPRFYLSI
jgi:type II protein arginine methyltransferase